MPVPNSMADLPKLASANFPTGTESIGNNLDNYLRSHGAIIRSTNAVASASIASASTTDIGSADGEYVQVTGGSTINSFGAGFAGCRREVQFTGSLTIVNSSNIVLPGGVNLQVGAGEIYLFRCTSSGVWSLSAGTRDRLAVAKVGDEMSGTLAFRGNGDAPRRMNVFHNANASVDFGAVVQLSSAASTTALGETRLVPTGANGFATEFRVNLKTADFFNSSFQTVMTVNGLGDLTVTGNLISTSDERLKKDWKPLATDLVDRFAALKAGEYLRTDTGARQVGAGAQSLEEFLPLAVSEDESGTKSIAYGNAALVGVVALSKRLLDLERRVLDK